MKIKSNIYKHKNKLIELQILKSKIYKISKKKKIENNKIKIYLKKFAQIIYEYHINNKTILFVNFPSKFENNLILLNKNIKHIFISKDNWINGFLTNKSTNIYSRLIKNFNESKISNKIFFFDLIVIFNPTNNHIFNESYNSYTPTIVISDELINNKIPLLKQSYKILGYFKFIEEQINNNFFFSILQAIFKQAILKKKTQQYRNTNYKFKLAKKKSRQYKTANYTY